LCLPPHRWSFIRLRPSACDLFEGVSSFGSPDEWLGVLIVAVFSEGHDSLLEILEDTTPDKECDMAKAYKSEALAAVHESMADLHKKGAIDSKTMRAFDRACLSPVLEVVAGRHPSHSQQSRCQPSGVCRASESDHRRRPQVGTGRERTAPAGGKIADSCGQAWHGGDCLKPYP
jgi:hypothetical protein